MHSLLADIDCIKGKCVLQMSITYVRKNVCFECMPDQIFRNFSFPLFLDLLMLQVDEYECECFAGYTGAHCESDINECQSGPCMNQGICVDTLNAYTCDCVPGFTGKPISKCYVNLSQFLPLYT